MVPCSERTQSTKMQDAEWKGKEIHSQLLEKPLHWGEEEQPLSLQNVRLS